MRHDLPNRIQLSAPKKRWYQSEAVKQAAELLTLAIVFFVSSFLMAEMVQWPK